MQRTQKLDIGSVARHLGCAAFGNSSAAHVGSCRCRFEFIASGLDAVALRTERGMTREIAEAMCPLPVRRGAVIVDDRHSQCGRGRAQRRSCGQCAWISQRMDAVLGAGLDCDAANRDRRRATDPARGHVMRQDRTVAASLWRLHIPVKPLPQSARRFRRRTQCGSYWSRRESRAERRP